MVKKTNKSNKLEIDLATVKNELTNISGDLKKFSECFQKHDDDSNKYRQITVLNQQEIQTTNKRIDSINLILMACFSVGILGLIVWVITQYLAKNI